MIKHILKIIWHQRRNNGWIFVELLLVFAVLCIMMDSLLVNLYTYYKPLGFDITNVYKVNIGKMSPEIPGYVPDSLLTTTDGEDLVRLVDNIRRAPQVDEICLAMNSCPYTWSNSWSQLVRADADTSVKANYYQMFNVTVSYFDVLRISDREGRPIRPIVEESTGDIVISGDMETDFFQGQSGKGKQVKWGSKSTTSETVAAVTSPIRQNEYVKSEPCFYYLMRTDEDIAKSASDAKPQNMDCLVRMRNGFRMEDMDSFLEKMGERLSVNNLYVSSVIPLEEQRPVILKSSIDNLKKKIALVGFMLVNVFFGIVGTFWLRTQYRCGEMGLRSALGASRGTLKCFLNVEGLFLLIFTIPVVLVFIFNMLYFDLPDTDRLAYTWWRFLVTFGSSCLLLAGMIWLGIWFPARRIAKMNPAEALHYE